MADREIRLREAFASLQAGDSRPLAELFTPDAQWHGVEDRGWDGATPT